MEGQTRLILLALATVGALVLPRPSSATVFNVASGDVAGLIAAIDAANAAPGADTIQLAAGTFTLGARHNGSDAAGYNGLPVITDVLDVVGAGAASTIIERSSGTTFRIARTAATGALRLAGLTLQGGSLTAGSTTVGSAVLSEGPLVVAGCTITGNTAESGGAIHATGGATIADSLIAGNAGTGIEAAPLTVISRTTIRDNSGGLAGGARLDGLSFITDSTIADNVSGHAGGVFLVGESYVRRSTISGNEGYAGGVLIAGDTTIDSCTISGNEGVVGGGIREGTAFGPSGKLGRIFDSTITNNHATAAGGGLVGTFLPSTTYRFELRNTILAGNTADSHTNDCGGRVVSLGHNLFGDTTQPECGLVSGPGDVIGVAPQLAALADNGGPTETQLPLPGSPAIDAGDACPAIDQRGVARPLDGDAVGTAICDIGAGEAGSSTPLAFFSDPFLCYAVRTSPGTPRFTPVDGVSLADDIETKTFDVRQSRALCNPADANGEGIADAVAHLRAYDVKQSTGQSRHVSQRGLRFATALGTFSLDTVAPERLLLPSAKSLAGPAVPLNPLDHDLDRFKCYKARFSSTKPRFRKELKLAISDQFTRNNVLSLRGLSSVCASVDKDAQGQENPAARLICFKTKMERRGASPFPSTRSAIRVSGVSTDNELGDEQIDTLREETLCVPARELP